MLDAGLKVLGGLAVWGVAWLPIAGVLAPRLHWRPFQPASPTQKLSLLLPLYGLAPLVIAGARWMDKGTWESYGVILGGGLLRSLLAGFLIAIIGLALSYSLQHRLRWLVVRPLPWVTQFQMLVRASGLLILGLWLGGVEELVFRGWMQTQLQQGFGPWLAAAIASLIFALAHLLWEGRPGLRQQPGLWLLGMVLVLARWADQGSLGLAWGLHAGWIWGLACLESAWEVSPTTRGSRWLIGHGQQPLTGALDLGLLAVTGVFVWSLCGGVF